MKKVSPCKECDHHRFEPDNCHDSCEPYLIWRAEYLAEKEMLKKARHEEDDQKRIKMRRCVCINSGALGRREK